MAFTEGEIAYIHSQPLGRIATVAADGQPDVVPVTFQFDGEHFYIGGIDPGRTRRTKNLRAGNDKVALIIDDLATVNPWRPRYLRVYGTAELVDHKSPTGIQPVMKITPTISWSVNLTGDHHVGDGDGDFTPHRTIHDT